MNNNMYESVYGNQRFGYLSQRRNIETLRDQRWFYKGLGLGEQSAKEDELENLMETLRIEYKIHHETMRMPFPPAEPFYKIKKIIEQCPLYTDVFRIMPKGGLLHVHSAAALSVEGLLELLEHYCLHKIPEMQEIYVITNRQRYQNRYIEGTLMYEEQLQANEQGGQQYKQYAEPLKRFLTYPENKMWLKELLSLCSDRAEQIPYIWDEFNVIFARTSCLFENRKFYLDYHVAFFKECLADSINYIELRCGFQSFKLKPNPKELDTEFLDVIKEAIEQVNKVQEKGKVLCCKVILCARRSLSIYVPQELDKLQNKVDQAIAIKQMQRYKELVIGFDFVSEEDRGENSMAYVKDVIYGPCTFQDIIIPPEIQAALKDIKDKKLERIKMIDFYLHDGESNWNKNENVIDAAIVSKKRIGHGFNMNKHQELVQQIVPMGGCIDAFEPILEICPISNQLLRYYPDLRNHSAYELMKQGIICVLGNDDPMILGNPGLSYDFWEAYVGWELDLAVIKGMVFAAYYYYQTNGVGEYDDSEIYTGFLAIWEPFIDLALNNLRQRHLA